MANRYENFFKHFNNKSTAKNNATNNNNQSKKQSLSSTLIYPFTRNLEPNKHTPVHIKHLDKLEFFLDGHREKYFAEIDSSCGLFDNLFNEIKNNKKSSYIIGIKDSILGNSIPPIMNVFKSKNFDNSTNEPSEDTIGCRILNHYRIPTAYYIDTIELCPIPEMENETYPVTHTLSPSFIAKDTKFAKLYDKFHKGLLDCSLDEWVYYIEESINDNYANSNVSEEELNKIKNQQINLFSYSYLVRKYLLNDQDFSANNVGELIDSEGNLSIIHYDYEQILQSRLKPSDTYYLSDDIRYISNNRPQVLKYFNQQTNILLQEDNFRYIFQDIDISDKHLNSIHNIMKDNYNTFTTHSNYITSSEYYPVSE